MAITGKTIRLKEASGVSGQAAQNLFPETLIGNIYLANGTDKLGVFAGTTAGIVPSSTSSVVSNVLTSNGQWSSFASEFEYNTSTKVISLKSDYKHTLTLTGPNNEYVQKIDNKTIAAAVAGFADQATSDGQGQVITNTYIKKADLNLSYEVIS